jgi:hypothetical protein
MRSWGCVLALVLLLVRKVRTAGDDIDRLTAAVDSITRVASVEEMKYQVIASIMDLGVVDADMLFSDDSLRDRVSNGGAVLYWMSASCAACRANYGVLESLANQYPGRVIAVSPAPVEIVKDDYNLMGVEVVQVPESAYRGLFPEDAFPVSLIVVDGRRIKYMVGSVDEREVRRVLSRIDQLGAQKW